MNTPISSSRMDNSIANISLYIPRVFKNIGAKRIESVFHNLRIGKVSAVNFTPKVGKHGHYNSVSIHFEYWYDNVAARNFQEKVIFNNGARIIYDDPWFWIVQEFRPSAPTAQKLVAPMAQRPCQGCEYIVALEKQNRSLEEKIHSLETELDSIYNNDRW